jgi:hypothetical protein
MSAQANGNQIALLPTFHEEVGSDVDMWIAVFLGMARQFKLFYLTTVENQTG